MDGDVSSEIGGNDGYTKLLCHMDTTPLIDDSDQLKSITNNGVSVNTSIKKFGAGSGYFDGSSYLEMTDSNDWDFSDGDFTIDFWVRFDDISVTGSYLVNQYDFPYTDCAFAVYLDDTDKITAAFSFDGTSRSKIAADSVAVADTWYHVAVIRNGSTFNLYIDGTKQTEELVSSNTLNDSSFPLTIGRRSDGDFPHEGYIDELRISKGIARWTSNFTPPTTYYGGHRLIPIGGPKLDGSIKKFGSSSMRFTESESEYVKVPLHNDFNFGTGNFTIDMWVRWASNSYGLVGCRTDDVGNYGLRRRSDYTLAWHSAGGDVVTTSSTCSDDTWYHVAVVRNSGQTAIFIDGTISSSWVSDNRDYEASNLFGIGAGYSTSHYLDGWLDEFRVSKGIARWTSNFTPPTEEYTTDEYTKLLLHFPGDMSDSNHAITFHDFARIDVSPTKWNGSFFFDGNDDYISIPDSDDWNFGDGDFTIDCWVRLNADIESANYFVSQRVDGSHKWYFAYNHSITTLAFYNESPSQIYVGSTVTLITGTWYHLAVSRTSGVMKLFINGVSQTLTTNTNPGGSVESLSAPLLVGTNGYGTYYLNGFMDELRIVNGEAIWTSDFTPPSEPYTIYELTGDLSDCMRLLSIRETDWNLIGNEEVTGNSYRLTYTTNDPVTIIGRKSDGESQGYGNINPS